MALVVRGGGPWLLLLPVAEPLEAAEIKDHSLERSEIELTRALARLGCLVGGGRLARGRVLLLVLK